MLNLNTKVELDVKHVKFPVYFEHKNICIHCGKQGSLVFVDALGRTSDGNEISTLEHMKCKNCGRIYSMRWLPLESNPDVYKPSAVEFNIKQDFMNLINSSIIKEQGEKVLD